VSQHDWTWVLLELAEDLPITKVPRSRQRLAAQWQQFYDAITERRAFRARIRGRGIFRWFDVPAVALRVPAHFPNTIVRSAGRGLRPRIQMKRVKFEWEQFNRSVEVHSVDRWFATAMLDPRMMEWLEQNLPNMVIKSLTIGSSPGPMCCVAHPSQPLKLIESLAAFNDHIPRSIPSLFPRGPGSLRWIHRPKVAAGSGGLDRLSEASEKSGRSSPSESHQAMTPTDS
jgi:hypothetical protein